MALKINGVKTLLSTFREVDRRYTAAAGKALEEGAKALSALARDMAPVDRGDLVRSIRARRVSDGMRTSWRVAAGGVIGGRDVSAYALEVHERMAETNGSAIRAPGGLGILRPGKASREKARRTGVVVGGRYMLRAYRQLQAEIKKSISEALKEETGSLNRLNRRPK
jgi:hypothetical protein